MGVANTSDFGQIPKINTTGEGAPRIFSRMGTMLAQDAPVSGTIRSLWAGSGNLRADPYNMQRQFGGSAFYSYFVIPESGYWDIKAGITGGMASAANVGNVGIYSVDSEGALFAGSNGSPIALTSFRFTVSGQIYGLSVDASKVFLRKGSVVQNIIQAGSASVYGTASSNPGDCYFTIDLVQRETRAGTY